MLQGKSKGQVAQAYSHRHAYKSKKAPGHGSGVRRASQASATSLTVGPAGSLRSKYGYDSSKYAYSKSKYRNG